MKTDCKHIKSRLSAYLDKQVDDVTKNLIESHITECKDCAEYLKNITDAEIIITAPLSKTPVFDTNSARRIFWDKTVKKAKAEGRFLFFLHKYAGTFAIILILLLALPLGFTMGHYLTESVYVQDKTQEESSALLNTDSMLNYNSMDIIYPEIATTDIFSNYKKTGDLSNSNSIEKEVNQ